MAFADKIVWEDYSGLLHYKIVTKSVLNCPGNNVQRMYVLKYQTELK